jgi:predicted MFS family arabinose efflux permease
MVASDLARAALFALMLLPLPIQVLLGLAFAAGVCSVANAGARAATLFEISNPDEYPATLSLNAVLHQAEILVGYALGGVIIAAVGAQAALGVNAATFLVSAALVATLRSTAASEQREDAALGVEGVRRGLRIWRDDPLCGRALLLFAGVAAFMVLPEALVVPAADDIGLPPALIGLMTALIAIGVIIGIALAPSGGDHADLLRRTAIRGMIASMVAAALFATGAIPAFIVLAFIVSGMADAVSIPTNQVVGERLPATGRAAAMAVAVGVANGTQVVSIAFAGLAADQFGTLVPLAFGMTFAAGVCLYAVVRPVRSESRATDATTVPAQAALADAA